MKLTVINLNKHAKVQKPEDLLQKTRGKFDTTKISLKHENDNSN